MAHRREVAGKWRKRFLSAMARTANAGLSARMAGVDKTTAFALRKRDPGFARDWVRARDWGRARVEAEGRPVHACGRPRRAQAGEAPEDARALVLRRSKRDGAQIVRAGEGRWTPEIEADFFAWLAAGFGVAHAARQIGFSTVALYRRRTADPGFATRWAAVREEGVARNDGLLIDVVPRAIDPEVMAIADGLPSPTIDEAIRIQRLYRSPVGGRGGAGRHDPEAGRASEKELNESLVAMLDVLERREAAKRLGEGWIRDEEGNWIPPGWGRKDEAA